MSFQNKNKIWINNSLKTGNETVKLLEMLKELGVFKKKAKKRKQRAKPEEQIMDEGEEEFLVPPSGGGGVSVDGVNPSSKVTDALQVLKSGASASASQQYLLEKAKEEAQVALGKVKDVAQRQGIDFSAYRPSEPKIEFDNEFEDNYLRYNENFFPEKEVVVPDTNYEMQEERSGTDIPQDVMDIDVSQKVSPEEGVFEDTEEDAFQAPTASADRPIQKKAEKEELFETERKPTFQEKVEKIQKVYGLKPPDLTLSSLKNKKVSKSQYDTFLRDFYGRLKLNNSVPPAAISRAKMDIKRQHIIDLIENQYNIISK